MARDDKDCSVDRVPEHFKVPRPRSATVPRTLGGPSWRLLVAETPSTLKPLTIRPAVRPLAGTMLRLLVGLLPTLCSAMHSRRDLVVENLALRQQLATLASTTPRHPTRRPALQDLATPPLERVGREPRRRPARHGRALAPRRLPDLLETGSPSVASASVALPCRPGFAPSSEGWPSRTPGAHPASTASSFDVFRAQRHALPAPLASRPENRPDGIAAMDFFSVGDFSVLQVLLFIRHGRREVARCAVTAVPTATWLRSGFARPSLSTRHRASWTSTALPSSRPG
jgi:hypothetical protein